MSEDGKSVVLIVDDSDWARETLVEALEAEGYELFQAAGGVEGLERAAVLKPDVILLDVMMPVLDGFQVCARLRADPDLAHAPVLMVTALDDRASRIRGLEAGADDFITKPFDRAELRARVRTVTRLNRYRKLRDEHARLEQEMEEKGKLLAQFLQAQKMEAVGSLAGGVAHDFNNHLTVILGRTELALARVPTTDPLRTDLEEVRDAAQRSADLTRQLLAFARKQTITPRVLDLNATVESMLKLLRRLIGADIELEWRPQADVAMTYMDPSQIDQVLANLCVNARDAIAGQGRVTIATADAVLDSSFCARHADAVPGEYVALIVGDNGCGMDSETQARIFDPFFTTKEPGKGTGLGLATVYGIVRQNRGAIDVDTKAGRGTTFTIYLPRHTAVTVPRPEARPSEPATHPGATILLVEDDLAILDTTTVLLEKMGHAVLAARSPGEAMRMVHRHTGRIDLVITDLVMPQMNGSDLAARLMAIHPGISCLFMSGYTADVIAQHGLSGEGVDFLQKPFTSQQLGAKIGACLARPG